LSLGVEFKLAEALFELEEALVDDTFVLDDGGSKVELFKGGGAVGGTGVILRFLASEPKSRSGTVDKDFG